MKRFLLREFIFLCMPLVVVGTGFAVSRVFHPPRNPNAKIALALTFNPTSKVFTASPSSPPNSSNLTMSWKAQARGGPKNGMKLGFSDRLVASGYGYSAVVYSDPSPGPRFPISSGTWGDVISDGTSCERELQVHYDQLPLWTQKLEWQGQIVASPLEGCYGALAPGISSAALRKMAQVRGAASLWKRVNIPLNARRICPLQDCTLEPIDASHSGLRATARVAVELKSARRRMFRCLEAFDGKTRRVLWRDDTTTRSPY